MKKILVCLVWLASLAGFAPLEAKPVLLVLGDSLSAEYGLARDTGWVKLLEARLAKDGFDYRVVNASISGETTSGGRSRLPALLTEWKPAVVVIELGANDGLRGLPLSAMESNLREMAQAARKSGAKVLIVGTRLPPNYGRELGERFHAVFARVANESGAAVSPFILDGFAEDLAFFQPDRIHPTQAAQSRMLANVWPQLRPLLQPARSGKKA